MTFVESVQTVFSKYATFSGRARRAEYWWFWLFTVILSAVAGFIGGFIFEETNYLVTFCELAVFLPQLAVTVRRMHDIGKSGLWVLISFIPFIGWILMIVWCATDSQPGDNQYGPNPKVFF